ncbi:UNVERIFIED_ORG: hypothetical protein M2438_002956 [Methylobacterium sp. SuP10 SLI 274]|uniref:hypothetical protein n=1 Tax=Methylorubrum extorquens TaxID=408 RepID=UPI00247C5855|nr:hypothetical protein [Methylorubrum extorquens]MDF9864188.1 hypothetical protein [Methylorubrum pseudosasae]MDH6637781.1 hypothetical protein [Methylobacterium sp. SuP10 SLI 274]MDH6666960.1 hypothetical protein [Methylorubrum zatmanii]MCP1558866.1 hypothetical protein [Methylorubrum extorquens]MDF9792500.1 hypothetical protein [Methylorubrum extorquens]
MQIIAKNGNYNVFSSFGLSVLEGTDPIGASGRTIEFSISQNAPVYNSFYWQIEPITGSYGDFWDNFFSNKVGGEPADAFAVSGFTSGNLSLKINPDNQIESDETFQISFYTSVLDPSKGVRPVISAQFTILDDDAPPKVPNSSSGGLIDYSYYLERYPDVGTAGLSPENHYNQFGWLEGRDPNAFFSTGGYLAANSDVAKAGINPLAHFDQFGWKEGRDPSAAFDNELYLARNADVKAAGMDPLLHFLDNGQAEGRKAYAAVGNASDLAKHEGFDAEYYLLANADVAKAALAAGGDTFQFAHQHFDAHGWKEGRDPNAVFDTKGYLDAYKDVAAAGINPLDHFHDSGWKEGRDAAADFDTKGYLAANADVKAVGVDPMLHYLQNGALEGRLAFNDGHFG